MSIPDGYRLFLDVIKGLDEAGRNRLRQDLYAGREHAFIQDPLLGNRLFASDKEDWLSDPRWTKAVEYGNGSCSAGGLYTEWPAHGRILVRIDEERGGHPRRPPSAKVVHYLISLNRDLTYSEAMQLASQQFRSSFKDGKWWRDNVWNGKDSDQIRKRGQGRPRNADENSDSA